MALEEFRKAPKPQVSELLKGEDGRVVVQVALPKEAARAGNSGGFFDINAWQRPQPRETWKTVDRHYDLKAKRYSWLLEGKGAKLVLQFEPLQSLPARLEI